MILFRAIYTKCITKCLDINSLCCCFYWFLSGGYQKLLVLKRLPSNTPPRLPVISDRSRHLLLRTPNSLLTVIGNLIIIKSFVSNPKLRTMNNLYIINLAIADIIIGLISMNFFTVYLVSGSWIFGPQICDAWLTIDYVASNTSVLTLVIICFDRYCSGKASAVIEDSMYSLVKLNGSWIPDRLLSSWYDNWKLKK